MHVIQLMIDVGKYQEALERLRSDTDDKILPPISNVMELEATVYEKLNQADKAEEQYRKLIELNPDNMGYYKSLLSLKGHYVDGAVVPEHLPKILTIMDAFAESNPKAMTPQRFVLDIVQEDEFRTRVQKYMQRALEKGVPSLFADLKGLCQDLEKQKAVEAVAFEFKTQYEAQGETSEALLWTHYLLAQILSHRTRPQKDYAQALELLELAGKRHPDVPEVLFAKAHVLKRAGDTEGAARTMEQSRLLDKSDRFLNGKAGKYWLRAGEIEKAEQVFACFTKASREL